jgi:hypothetical protein
MNKKICFVWIAVFYFVVCAVAQEDIKRIPIIYSTDLFQPPEDPDDHYDLAVIASLREFDLKALVFDMSTSHRNPEEIGLAALHQMSVIANQPIPPYAMGLRYHLTSADDKAENQPEEYQKGVALILKTLRESDEKMTLFLVGSCRDFAVAYNREPELLKEKVAAVYVNAGNGPDGKQFEWNVMLDSYSYLCLMNSGLPIYWSPCFSSVNLKVATPEEVTAGSDQAFNTYFIVPNQADLLRNSSGELKNYFKYALSKSQEEPLPYLKQLSENLPETPRNMWCTGPFLHAAGRRIYAYKDSYIACSPQKAQLLGIQEKEIDVYQFKSVLLTSVQPETSDNSSEQPTKKYFEPVFKGDLNASDSPVKVFRYIHPEYNTIMVSVLSEILHEL